MKAYDMLSVILEHTIDAPYTIDGVAVLSDKTIVVNGYYHPDNGSIEDQLTIGLRTYFKLTDVVYSLEHDEMGYRAFGAHMTRKPAFAQVPDPR